MHLSPTNKSIAANKSGFAIMFAVIIGTVMLILAVSLYTFVGHQHSGIQSIVNGEIAHFLAEAGINSSIGSVREAVAKMLANASGNPRLNEILRKPGEISDVCIDDMLDTSWNKDLKEFAREIDKEAAIEVNVWLRDFRASETETSSWADPVAKDGYLVIESTGTFKGTKRVILIKRRVRVGSVVPAWLSKFSLYVGDAAKSGEGSFNLIRNDYRGMITDGPKPLIVYNHATPDAAFEAGNISDIIREEADPTVWQRRGWLWMGGRRSRLNLCSGAGDLGEIFHFYDVSNPNIFSPVKFTTPVSALPESFAASMVLPWDKSSSSVRQVSYRFGHSFVLDGFHDRSSRKDTDAMYEGNILSSGEKSTFTSKSSILHLYGDARKGYQSRTRVFGQVYAAFPRYANLEVKPEEPDVEELFAAARPPPLYLLPSISEGAWNNSISIHDIMRREVGGPLLKTGMLCRDHSEYSLLMSRISELPYVESYNSMQDVYSGKTGRFFPSDAGILAQDSGLTTTIERNQQILFKGRPSATALLQTLKSRTHIEVDSINDFWQRFLNERNELELNAIVSIRNSRQLDMQIPAGGKPQPLIVKGGGMIILEQGSLVLRGISCSSPDEALTVVMAGTGSVSFTSTQANHVNIVAPGAELGYGSKFDIYGSLCVGSIYADHRFQGGTLRFRTGQDPTTSGYERYYKVFIDPKDSFWNE
ncbi:MAG: hypothetical protein CVV41_14515 [Candidatus Riflebacteria bacterium HGW-Riflebacteria-1]|jgi:hypothetical protein|nr:MAG: hypothetical protein CVV41_14515 [Candidatus Riflebacteria bacterium HGW-Riflebacteria-1]